MPAKVSGRVADRGHGTACPARSYTKLLHATGNGGIAFSIPIGRTQRK
jgi:hypothetical protein